MNNMTYKELSYLVMPEEKRKSEKYNLWVAYVVRPASILLCLPLIKVRIRPTTITKISVLFVIIGIVLFVVHPQCIISMLLGWLCFFIWAILDGVDGNLARATNQCSEIGELWDAIGGYFAMFSIYLMAGVLAYHDGNSLFSFCEKWWLLLLGGATSVFSIFPRLVMHKKEGIIFRNSGKIEQIVNKKEKTLINILSLNLLSASGFFQVIFLISILVHMLNWFVLFYFIANSSMMLISIIKMVK